MKSNEFIFGSESYGNRVEYNSYEKIEELLEKSIMPKVKRLKDGRMSVALSEILGAVKGAISKENLEYIFECLEEKDIKVIGKDSSIDMVKNYEYINTYKQLKAQKEKALTKEENIALFSELSVAKTEAHKAKLRHQIIVGNISLVPFYLFKLAYMNNIPCKELESYGYEALIKAVDHFDYSMWCAFSTYAHYWIYYQAIDAILTEYNYLPSGNYSFFLNMLAAKEVLLDEGFDEEEIHPNQIIAIIEQVRGKLFGKKKKQFFISRILINSPKFMSIEELDNFPSNEKEIFDQACDTCLKEDVEVILNTLTARQKNVIIARFGLNDGRCKTLDEVSKMFECNRERIRQIEAAALRKLRHPSRTKIVRDYLN